MSNKIIQFLRRKDFRFIQDIGQGGLGRTVLLADDIINEKFVCKKYAPLYDDIKEEYFPNFVEEIKLLHLLHHRNIVRVFNYYLYPEQFTGYILMEYIEGEEIHTYIKKSPERINDVFFQVIQGFKYLESIEILHRDIRPQNILVSNDGVVKIIDFGFGKKVQFAEEFDKSISLNWRFNPPKEFDQQIYDFCTEVYFIGKLFEEILKENQIENFNHTDLLLSMIKHDNNNRVQSFFNVLREIEGVGELGTEFSTDEIEVYRIFANAISEVISSIYFGASYIDDIDSVLQDLEEIRRNSLLEEFVQNNNKVIRCFIKGNFKYYKNNHMLTWILRDFVDMFRAQSYEKKKVILNHLWNRFDAVEREVPKIADDDLPF